MTNPRRDLLFMVLSCCTLSFAKSWRAVSAQTPQPMPSPNAPSQNFPAGLDGPRVMKPDQQPRAPINQEQIAASVQQLYRLATELKEQVEHTNLGAVFPVSLVKNAQEIEKLAKHIKNAARG
jgi:hypothetical protein